MRLCDRALFSASVPCYGPINSPDGNARSPFQNRFIGPDSSRGTMMYRIRMKNFTAGTQLRYPNLHREQHRCPVRRPNASCPHSNPIRRSVCSAFNPFPRPGFFSAVFSMPPMALPSGFSSGRVHSPSDRFTFRIQEQTDRLRVPSASECLPAAWPDAADSLAHTDQPAGSGPRPANIPDCRQTVRPIRRRCRRR